MRYKSCRHLAAVCTVSVLSLTAPLSTGAADILSSSTAAAADITSQTDSAPPSGTSSSVSLSDAAVTPTPSASPTEAPVTPSPTPSAAPSTPVVPAVQPGGTLTVTQDHDAVGTDGTNVSHLTYAADTVQTLQGLRLRIALPEGTKAIRLHAGKWGAYAGQLKVMTAARGESDDKARFVGGVGQDQDIAIPNTDGREAGTILIQTEDGSNVPLQTVSGLSLETESDVTKDAGTVKTQWTLEGEAQTAGLWTQIASAVTQTDMPSYTVSSPALSVSQPSISTASPDEDITVSGITGSGTWQPDHVETTIEIPEELITDSITLPDFSGTTWSIYVDGVEQLIQGSTLSVNQKVSRIRLVLKDTGTSFKQTKPMVLHTRNTSSKAGQVTVRAHMEVSDSHTSKTADSQVPIEIVEAPTPTETPTPTPTERPVTPAPTEKPVTPIPTERPVTPNPTDVPVNPTRKPTETPEPTETPKVTPTQTGEHVVITPPPTYKPTPKPTIPPKQDSTKTNGSGSNSESGSAKGNRSSTKQDTQHAGRTTIDRSGLGLSTVAGKNASPVSASVNHRTDATVTTAGNALTKQLKQAASKGSNTSDVYNFDQNGSAVSANTGKKAGRSGKKTDSNGKKKTVHAALAASTTADRIVEQLSGLTIKQDAEKRAGSTASEVGEALASLGGTENESAASLTGSPTPFASIQKTEDEKKSERMRQAADKAARNRFLPIVIILSGIVAAACALTMFLFHSMPTPPEDPQDAGGAETSSDTAPDKEARTEGENRDEEKRAGEITEAEAAEQPGSPNPSDGGAEAGGASDAHSRTGSEKEAG